MAKCIQCGKEGAKEYDVMIDISMLAVKDEGFDDKFFNDGFISHSAFYCEECAEKTMLSIKEKLKGVNYGY